MTAKIKSRIAVLRERVEVAEKGKHATYDVPFRGQNVPLRKIAIEVSFPLYRIKSGRTRRAQSQYLDEHPELSQDFFSDPEDPKVQQAQHQLLLRMIGEMELDKDLVEKGQRAPLILTFDGYVVDGNRRLAALRDEGKQEYLDAVVLPKDAQNHEIYETELELQMQRETKAPYNWIDQALHLEYGIKELHEPRDVLAKRMRLSVEEIDRALSKLALVRLYLDWLGEPGKYHKVPSERGGSMEQAFEDLAQRLGTLSRRPESERRMIRNACFAAIHQQAGYKQVRNLIRQLGQNSQKVLGRLKERQPALANVQDQKVKETPTSAPTPVNDPLLSLVEEVTPTTDPAVEELLSIVSDPTKTAVATPMLLDIVEELEAEAKDAKQSQAPLKLIQHATGDLEKVELEPQTDRLDLIAKALDDVFRQAERLRDQVGRLRTEK